MKIIQGKYKGIVLKGFDIDGTRPTMDRVKESLFAMIQDHIQGKIVLDLFAGSGALGIEALSMGAETTVFVDKNSIACKTIQENLNKIKVNSKILKLDYKKALESFSEQIQFDLILLDPPYDTNYIEKSLELIIKFNLISNNGLIVCESNDLSKIKIPSSLEIVKSKQYGQKIVVILKK